MAIADISAQLRTISHWIGGKPAASNSGRSGVVWNRATGEAQAKVDFASPAEVDQAVEIAKQACVEWRPRPSRAAPKSCSSCASWWILIDVRLRN